MASLVVTASRLSADHDTVSTCVVRWARGMLQAIATALTRAMSLVLIRGCACIPFLFRLRNLVSLMEFH